MIYGFCCGFWRANIRIICSHFTECAAKIGAHKAAPVEKSSIRKPFEDIYFYRNACSSNDLTDFAAREQSMWVLVSNTSLQYRSRLEVVSRKATRSGVACMSLVVVGGTDTTYVSAIDSIGYLGNCSSYVHT